jgi:hypothetical protein
MTHAVTIENPTQLALKNAYAFVLRFEHRPLTEEGKQFLTLIKESIQNIQRMMANSTTPDSRMVEELFILNTMISEPDAEIVAYFGAGEVNYGIEFCQSGIMALKKQQVRLIFATGKGFPEGSPDAIQLANFHVMLKRFQSEKARGVAPSYNPKLFAQFA